MSQPMNLIGFYLEDDESAPWGFRIVLVQPHTTEKVIEHEATGPEQLWAAFMAIAEDPGLPAPTMGEGPDAAAAVGGGLYDAACDHAEAFVSAAAGPVFGRLAGAAVRNRGRDALQFLRLISRNGGKDPE